MKVQFNLTSVAADPITIAFLSHISGVQALEGMLPTAA